MSNRSDFHLFHGGHKGTEAEFGRAAEKWGIPETTYSYEGHQMERAVNVQMLTDEELRKGRVSLEFVFETLGRRFVHGKGIRRVLKMMFHLVVSTGSTGEVFAVGWIQDDGTVKGGTGWGVELAKLFNRKTHVFDQNKDQWFSWDNHEWRPGEPVIHPGKFCATGTRNLTHAGSTAIDALYARSLEAAGITSSTSESSR